MKFQEFAGSVVSEISRAANEMLVTELGLPHSRGEAIVIEARTWIADRATGRKAVRYHHQGRSRVGVDCIGLVGSVAAALGVKEAAAWAADQGAKGYGREPDEAMLRRMCAKYFDPVDPFGIGDILLLIVPPVKTARHFAIVVALDPLRVVHAYAPARMVVETALPATMRIAGAFRYRQ